MTEPESKSQPPVIKRFSLLHRRSQMERTRFLEHYENIHGPLAAGQEGFRQFTYRYHQNHVQAGFAAGLEPPYDGISVTYQKPRADYRDGFFGHPDYANVRADEAFLFDLDATVSVLAREQIVCERDGAAAKAIFLVADSESEAMDDIIVDPPAVVRKAVRNSLDGESASALGIGEATSPWREIWEVWFASDADRERGCRDRTTLATLGGSLLSPTTVALAVRELVVFSEDER
jgi:hypothetical protein